MQPYKARALQHAKFLVKDICNAIIKANENHLEYFATWVYRLNFIRYLES
jgi:hypothetical protein